MPEIERDGVTLHYETMGPELAPPVVLLHGFTSDLRNWLPVASELAEAYRVIMPDLRGHGRSDSPAGLEHYTIGDYAEDLRALLDELAIDLCAIIGSSFGGMVAMEFAVEHPERVAAVVLSDTSPAPERPEYDEAFRARERRIDDMVSYAERFGTRALGKKLARDVRDQFLQRGMEARYARMTPEGMTGAAHARRTRRDLTALLRERLRMPVMLVMGMDDPVYCALAVMVAELPGARQVIFRDTGHGVPTLRPEQFVDQLAEFFRDLQDDRPVAKQITV